MAAITIDINVPAIDTVLLSFDKIQMQRSKLGSLYADAQFITSELLVAPVITGTTTGPYADLSGEELRVRVDGGTAQSVTFLSADPISTAFAVEEINEGTTGLVAADDGTGKLQLTGNLVGTGGTIEITGGGAAVELGLSQVAVHGTDQRISLVADVNDYAYVDLSGELAYWYRYRYYDETLETYDDWSDWVQGSTGAAISADDLIVGKIMAADIDGTALSGLRVNLTNVYSPLISDSYFLAGRTKQIETDATGMAETDLIKGMLLDVVIEGTSIIRRITVPTTGVEFDLLDPDLVEDDPFNIQVPDLPSAVRRS